MRGVARHWLLLLCSLVTGVLFAADSPEDTRAAMLLKQAGVDQGMCLVAGETDGKFTAALAKNSRLYVHGLAWNAKDVELGRALLVSAGVIGQASIVSSESDGHLPYAGNLINLVVCPGWTASNPAKLEELLRVLTPGATALLGNESQPAAIAGLAEKLKLLGVTDIKPLAVNGWTRFIKPENPDLDVWSHNEGGADLSYVSNDKVVGPWQGLRWIGGPKFGSLFSSYLARVTDGGRLYYLENRAAQGGTQLFLACRDAYNGFEYWRVVAGSANGKRNPFVGMTLTCDARNAYLVEEKVLVARDGRTGKKIREFAPGFVPAKVTSVGKVLLVSNGSPSASQAAALSKETGQPVWNRPSLVHPAAVQGVAHVLSATELEAVDCASGDSRWKVKIEAANGTPKLYCKGDVIYVQYQPPWKPVTALVAYAAKDGAELWRKEPPGGKYGMLPTPDKFYLLNHNGSPKDPVTVTVLDSHTGTKIEDVQTKGMVRTKCFPAKGTPNFLLYSNTWYYDMKGKVAVTPHAVRSPCALGQCPANGLTYFLPHHCTCEVTLRGILAMAPDDGLNWLAEAGKTPAAVNCGSAPAALKETEEDWPMYRHDIKRSNAASMKLPNVMQVAWNAQAGKSVLTQATVAYGLVFTAEPRTHRVMALDAATGKEQWSFVADGRVEFSPALYRGLCLFGTGAGTVHALDAKTGKPVWRLRAAPAQKFIAEDGQFASAWPVIGGVMPLDDAIYFTCGRAPKTDGGVWMFAVEAATGKVRWKKEANTSGDMFITDGKSLLDVAGAKTRSAQKTSRILSTTTYGYCAIADIVSCMDPALTYERHNELTDGRIRGESIAFNESLSVAGWRYKHGGGGAANCGPDWRKKKGVYFIWAEGSAQWRTENISHQFLAVILCGDTAVYAGVPVSRNPSEKPELWVVDGKDGKKKQVLPLEAAPSIDGLSAAGGRVYLATEDGRMVCFGK